MHSSIYLTVLVVLSLILPDFINLVTSNFSIIDAELKYYRNMGDELQKYKESLVESLKAKYELYYNPRNNASQSSTNCQDLDSNLANKNIYDEIFQETQKQQNDSMIRAQGSDEALFEKFINQKVSDLSKRFVSKTTKNEIILDQYNDKVYLVSIDNKFLFTDDQSYSFVSIMEMQDEKLFGNISYERNSDIQWRLCTLHKINGVIKDIQFDTQKQNFLINYIDTQNQSFIRVYNSTSFCQKQKNQFSSFYKNDNKMNDQSSEQQESVQTQMKFYQQKHNFRIEDIFKLTKETKYDQKNYLEIPMNYTQILRMTYYKNLIIYSSLADRSLMKTIKISNNQDEAQLQKINLPNFSYIDKDYVQVLSIQVVDILEEKGGFTQKFIAIVLKGNSEDVFIECELYKTKFDQNREEIPKIDNTRFFFNREEAQTLFSKNVSQYMRNIDIFENNLFPHVHTAYSKMRNKFVVNILDQFLILVDFSIPSMIGIIDIEPTNYSKLIKEGFKIKKMHFSENGNFLCILTQDQEQHNQIFLLEMSKINSINKFQQTEMFQIKEVRDRIKNHIIKDFSAYEGDENAQQLNSVLLLEGGEILNMSLCTNCTNKFKKSVVKELVDIFSTLLISIGFIILFICAKQLMANIEEEQDDY
ncbi:transmembrane protein, putative (macronuclear) [Tetrahymena thermophila SB210]|uniref:Transmembrane protein, putative n=1 Tax=Tetrahymena thermophila (strain SB210) TaxID=312017 RepID=I7MLK2_TETTS|nr:transmembrane protein, putative [Tetrahymena thermophila SB210]EAS02450.2 transmembrane protein, putative [Tetrahymena thermophila SB210]|eukprot:XP_001022695.2 transmembrane protein, putative [Tetrahymena thermophila SB210]